MLYSLIALVTLAARRLRDADKNPLLVLFGYLAAVVTAITPLWMLFVPILGFIGFAVQLLVPILCIIATYIWIGVLQPYVDHTEAHYLEFNIL